MNIACFANTSYAGGRMDNIQNFNAFGCNAIKNEMRVEDDVAVFAAFSYKIPAFGVKQIIRAKSFYKVRNSIEILLCLCDTKSFYSIFKYIR